MVSQLRAKPTEQGDGYGTISTPDSTHRGFDDGGLEHNIESERNDDDQEHLSASDDLIPISDAIPVSSWMLTIVEACERFAFFGIQGPLQNYIQLPASGGVRHGGLGLGQKNATFIKLLFTIWCYITPIGCSIIADQYLGRYRTILYAAPLCIFGLAILTGSSLLIHSADSIIPQIGLFVSMVTIGIGTGGLKTNVVVLVAEQYTPPPESDVKVRLSNGKMARIDYDATLQRMILIFYLILNVGSFAAIITTELELKYGFTWAYALSLIVSIIGTVILVVTGSMYKKSPPAGSVLPDACRILTIALRHGGDLDSARPDNLLLPPSWTNQQVSDVRQVLYASRVLAILPFFWCVYSQVYTNLVSQAGTMNTGSIPNDVFVSVDALMLVILTPVFDRIIYPFLQRRAVKVSQFRRIAVGFFVAALSMAYATVLQRKIYLSPPCYDHPLSAACKGGQVPNEINVFWQLPVYILMASSEILVVVTSLEFAVAAAPKSMKSLVLAIFTSSNAVGLFLAIVLGRLADDPWMTTFYASLTVEVFVAGLIFCYAFRHSIIRGSTTIKDAFD